MVTMKHLCVYASWPIHIQVFDTITTNAGDPGSPAILMLGVHEKRPIRQRLDLSLVAFRTVEPQ